MRQGKKNGSTAQGEETGLRKERKQQTGTLFLFLIILVFVILMLTFLITSAVLFLLVRGGALTVDVSSSGAPLAVLVAFFLLASLVISFLVSIGIIFMPMRDLNSLIRGLHRLADGDFAYRMDVDRRSVGRDVARSFNTLAQELEGTEMLRSDFVNNFSHEIKTPIVSIRGFARLLQKTDLTGQQQEYADIIAQESNRLAEMTRKILDLTKVENQSILSDVEEYNLSEQLRQCCLLFMDRAEEKNLAFEADFPEVKIRGNADLLKEVWVNLLDNAVKFSSQGGVISLSIRNLPETVSVQVTNPSEPLSEEAQKRLFQKFYQGETSHSGEGTGIGLSLVKRIAALHGGDVRAKWQDGLYSIRVILPR